MAEVKDYCIEYITNGGSYHAFNAMVEDLETAIELTLCNERRGRYAIPKATIKLKPPKGQKAFNLMNNFRINDMVP